MKLLQEHPTSLWLPVQRWQKQDSGALPSPRLHRAPQPCPGPAPALLSPELLSAGDSTTAGHNFPAVPPPQGLQPIHFLAVTCFRVRAINIHLQTLPPPSTARRKHKGPDGTASGAQPWEQR